MRLIFRFLKPHWKLCALTVFLLIVDVAGALIIPTLAAEPLTETSYMINSLQSALASAERTFAFLDDEEEVPDTKTPVVLERAHGEIAFEHVSFGYFPDKILMKDISFTAHPGQKIAVVGATGAGKTTLHAQQAARKRRRLRRALQQPVRLTAKKARPNRKIRFGRAFFSAVQAESS